jgi:8-oxo-dGDP phosphatase
VGGGAGTCRLVRLAGGGFCIGRSVWVVAASVSAVVKRAGEPDRLRWRQHGERTVYDSPWVRVTKVDVTAPDGQRFEHHAVRLHTVASAVVMDSQDRVLLVWRHRFITNSWGWETPGGIVDDGETSEQTAVRETVEETGWRPEDLQLLAAFQPMPGLVDTPHEVYLSRRAVKVAEPSDATEAGVVDWIPMAEVPALMERGEIAGSGSLVGLLCAAGRLG